MTDHTTRRDAADGGKVSPDTTVSEVPGERPDLGGTDAYEVDDGVVLFDVDNPLAWVEADDAVSLSEFA